MITAKYQDEVKKKDKEIEFLRATMKKLEVSKASAFLLSETAFCTVRKLIHSINLKYAHRFRGIETNGIFGLTKLYAILMPLNSNSGVHILNASVIHRSR